MEINGMGLLGVSLASYTLGYMLCWYAERKNRAVAKATVDKASKSLAEASEVLMEQRDLIQTQLEFTDYLKGQAEGMLAQRNAVAENLRFERQLHEQTQAKLQAALTALRRISLGAQNSMTSKEDLGREARKATADE